MLMLSFQDGLTALMPASALGDSEIVKFLIEANASLDLQRQVYSEHRLINVVE